MHTTRPFGTVQPPPMRRRLFASVFALCVLSTPYRNPETCALWPPRRRCTDLLLWYVFVLT